MNIKTIILPSCLIVIVSTMICSQRNTQEESKGNWKLLGKTYTYATDDHGAVVVPGKCIPYKEIKFKIAGPPVNINRIIIIYDTGQPQTLFEPITMKENGFSKAIPLYSSRNFCRIDFWCGDNDNKSRTFIAVFALQ